MFTKKKKVENMLQTKQSESEKNESRDTLKGQKSGFPQAFR